MSVDMETTVKTWNDVPEKYKQQLGKLISEIQTDMLSHFGVIDSIEDIDDENDNGFFPELDIEVHTTDDPDASTRRLVITNKPEEFSR